MTTTTYSEALNTFLAYALSIQSTPPAPIEPDSFSVQSGHKYDRIVVSRGSQKSAFCFIRREDGAVFKTASWKAPAKGIRGTIFTQDSARYGITQYGAVYHN